MKTSDSFDTTMNGKERHIVILADGDFPRHPYPIAILKSADTIVCCDNSVLKLSAHTEIEADYIVGDMDTMSPENKLRFKKKIRQFPDQETNDLTKAFKFVLGLNPTKITVLGATGAREDHSLGNISLLADYTKEFPNIETVTDYGIFTSHCDSFAMESVPGQQISIFAFDPTLKIKSAGLVYPTDSVIFDRWWKATLNEAASTSFALTFSHPAEVLVFRAFV